MPMRKVRHAGVDFRGSYEWSTELGEKIFLLNFTTNLSLSLTSLLYVEIFPSTQFRRVFTSVTKLEYERKVLTYTFPVV
jgi:hypothetical protein